MWSLQRLGFAVSFAPMDGGPASPDLASHGIVCLTRPWYTTIEKVLARNANTYAVVYLHRADVAAFYGALVRKYQAVRACSTGLPTSAHCAWNGRLPRWKRPTSWL